MLVPNKLKKWFYIKLHWAVWDLRHRLEKLSFMVIGGYDYAMRRDYGLLYKLQLWTVRKLRPLHTDLEGRRK